MNKTDLVVDTTVSQHPRPRWSAKTSFHAAVVIMLTTIPVVFGSGITSALLGLEIVFAIVTLQTFLFLLVVLYKGVRFKGTGAYGIAYKPLQEFRDVQEVQFGTAAGAMLGPVGCLFGVVFDL